MVRISSRLAPIAACSIALLILLSGCGNQKYRSLDQLPKTNTFMSTNHEITGTYTFLNAEACKACLGGDVLSKGYQPIYITLTNNTNQALYFDTKKINITTVKPADVAQSIHTNPRARAIGLGIPGAVAVCSGVTLLAWPFLGAPLICAPILAVPVLVFMGLSITPAIKSSKNAVKINKSIDDNCELKALHSQMIAPHACVNGLIFTDNQAARTPLTIQ
jgi:hypothetical protein